LEKGRRIDRYEVREPIGRGTTGAVYRAVDSRLGRVLAIKIVDGADGRGPAAADREQLMRGVLAASRIDHPNVVQVLDFGLVDGAVPYIVSEYLHGGTLAERLAGRGGAIEVAEAADVGLAVCAALRACHDGGVVHGGLTPRKIFLAETDTGPQVKLRDVGLRAAPAAAADDLRALAAVLETCVPEGMPEALRALLARAAAPAGHDRFESAFAFGRELWPFASPAGKDRWRDFYFRPARSAATPPPFEALGPFDVPAKELGPTQFLSTLPTPPALPESDAAAGGDRRALPIAAAGGTVLDRPAGELGGATEGSAAGELALATASATARSATPRPRRRVFAWVAAAGAGLLAAIVLFAALGRSADRRPASAGPRPLAPNDPPVARQVTPTDEGMARQVTPPPAKAAPRTATPPPDPPAKPSKAFADDVAKPARLRKHPSRRRKLPNVDANGVGILE